MSKRFILTIAMFLVIGVSAGIAIMLTKGYTFSSKEKKVVGTGIIAVSSLPDGASVYIDGHLATATNTTISQLTPKKYNIKLVKEGFISWEKDVDVRGGLVSEVKATLFPALPTTYPLTFNSALNPILSPDGQKLAFAVPQTTDVRTRQKGGLWVWGMSAQPISFSRGAEPHQIIVSTPGLDFSKAKLRWSPDSKQLLATLQEGGIEGDASQRNYLLPSDRQTSASDLRDTTPIIASTLSTWEEDQKTKEAGRVLVIKDFKIKKIASDSALLNVQDTPVLRWSPDETKFMVINKGTGSRVSGKEVKTEFMAKAYGIVSSNEYTLPVAKDYIWLPDSLHIILIHEDKIALSEFDGSNVSVIYAGKFDDSLVFPWPDSSRLVFIPTMSTPTGSQPNLFGINLK